MKTKNVILSGLLVLAPVIGFAQEWDDIYADPAKKTATLQVQKKEEPQKKKIVVVEGKADNGVRPTGVISTNTIVVARMIRPKTIQ